jgi:hypothetical protein
MRWTKDRPTRPGYYLRNNPAVLAIVKQIVWEIDGCLRTNTADGGAMPLERMHPSFWWFGPIPAPPGKSE